MMNTPHVDDYSAALAYLHKREQQMAYEVAKAKAVASVSILFNVIIAVLVWVLP